jgi:DNA polymerase-3 subunit delta
MILKNYEINKINQNINHFILFYGKNEGLKNEALHTLIKNENNISNYDEKEILDNENNFIESILSKSLFELEKIVVIKRATDKILNILQALQFKKLDEVTIILNSENLDKKSKLRSFFEKEKELICVPFYPDNDQTLSKLTYNFLKDKNISISPLNVNLIVNKCSGDREALFNELQKIEYFVKNGKQINNDNISKLINLSENHSISELVDNCLAQNKKKIINILNENNFSNEDCMIIVRFFLIKAKKLLTLSTVLKLIKI